MTDDPLVHCSGFAIHLLQHKSLNASCQQVSVDVVAFHLNGMPRNGNGFRRSVTSKAPYQYYELYGTQRNVGELHTALSPLCIYIYVDSLYDLMDRLVLWCLGRPIGGGEIQSQ